jgi:hypothetical protein
VFLGSWNCCNSLFVSKERKNTPSEGNKKETTEVTFFIALFQEFKLEIFDEGCEAKKVTQTLGHFLLRTSLAEL